MELFSFLLSIAFYVFTSLGYYRISESLGLGNSWMTFVPIVNLFKIGEISDTLRGLQNKPDKKRRIVLPVASIISGFVMGIALFLSFLMIGIAAEEEMVFLIVLGVLGIFVSFAIMLIPMIFQYMCIFDIYKAYTKEATLFLILSILFPYVMPFLIFFACDPTKATNNPMGGGVVYNQPYAQPQAPQANEYKPPVYDAPVNNVPPVTPPPTYTAPSYAQPPQDAVGANGGIDLNKHE